MAKIRCPHCGVSFSGRLYENPVRWSEHQTGFNSVTAKCPECENFIVSVANERTEEVYPINHTGRLRGVFPNVPAAIMKSYEHACRVLAASPEASAALSRRALQHLLRVHGYDQKDLVKQIEALLTEKDPKKVLPDYLLQQVDAIRNFGNFSAHPVNDQTTLQVIDVEPQEADWCLEILEDLFEHYYEAPARNKARKDALNAKLTAAGKPLAK